ncbi:MAG: hypothetical protein WCI61_11790, partial [Chloroflexota bacterium]
MTTTPTTSTGGSASASAHALYGPVAADLPRVSEALGSIATNVEFAFLQKMLENALAGTGKMMRPA